MALKAIVENLDDVAEEHRGLYVEKDGKFVLDLDNDIREHPNVTALSNALTRQKEDNRKIKEELDAAKARLANIPDDFDPEELATLKERLAELEDGLSEDEKAKRKKEATQLREVLEQRIAAERKKHETEKAELEAKLADSNSRIERLLVDNGLEQAMDSANIDPKFRKAVRAMLRDQVKVIDRDGESIAVVETELDPELPLDKYVADWAGGDEGRIYVGQPKGGGSNGSDGNKSTVKNPWSKDHWNLTEQGRLLRENPTKARQLAKEAGKSIPG